MILADGTFLSEASSGEAAQWMWEEVQAQGELHQRKAVDEIAKRFGERWVYINKNGNNPIHPYVLDQFDTITGSLVVWVRKDYYWRLRQEGDPPKRTVHW